MTFSPADFKRAMSQFASGVTVVTTRYGDKPIGMTASSFTSLSLDPPLVLVAVNKRLFTHNVIADSGIFAVNVLSARQLELGMRFAGMRPEIADRFAGLETGTATHRQPDPGRLPGLGGLHGLGDVRRRRPHDLRRAGARPGDL